MEAVAAAVPSRELAAWQVIPRRMQAGQRWHRQTGPRIAGRSSRDSHVVAAALLTASSFVVSCAVARRAAPPEPPSRSKVVLPTRRPPMNRAPTTMPPQRLEAKGDEKILPPWRERVTAMCLAEELDLELVARLWEDAATQDVVPAGNARRLGADACLVELEDGRCCFFFGFGLTVCWGLDGDELRHVRILLQQNTRESVEAEGVSDYMSFSLGCGAADDTGTARQHTALHNDHVQLETSSVDEALAYSYAFAQSVKLKVFEHIVDDAIEQASPIPEALAHHGQVEMDDQAINKQMGDIFVTKCSMMLQSDILDTPDILWENDEFASQYKTARKYLEMGKRIDILNQRLTVLNELYSFLREQLQVKHANRLEVIVIVLIVVEILLDLFHMSPWYDSTRASIFGGLLLAFGAVWLQSELDGHSGGLKSPRRMQMLLSKIRKLRPLTLAAVSIGALWSARGLLAAWRS
eukprot:TRINITY_DN81146_c0_g1_i1.p1 TRINITY_DN81146_c0_g1~~TRINITY_DN81146_c0_g1_i1.p1  ORF type:complete len:466 (-),score=72.16 TRINITY_DN81146_c0_g1_i1:56-1453(-)